PRLPESGAPAMDEALTAERSLRDLAYRVAGVEKTMRLAPEEARGGLEAAHAELTGQLQAGVTAYERLVAAAAKCVAAHRPGPAAVETTARLTDAGDLLQGLAAALAELRTAGGPIRAT
ncbi:MAG TPA: hypothetical protein VF462_00720, partial [Micromonosporaceae bacterium]